MRITRMAVVRWRIVQAVDFIDDRIIGHRVYAICQWCGSTDWWEPASISQVPHVLPALTGGIVNLHRTHMTRSTNSMSHDRSGDGCYHGCAGANPCT